MSQSKEQQNWEDPSCNPIQVDSSAVAGELASLQNRFFACLIDGLSVGIVASILWMPIVMSGFVPWLLAPLVASTVAFGVFAAANFKLLESNGQTIGKKVMNIRIVGNNGEKMDAKELLGKRYAIFWFLNAIPYIGGLIALANVLMALRDSRRAGHDEVADTKVVNC